MKELQIIQAKLKVPKDNSTKFYKFRNLEDINEKVKPLLDETGCSLTLSDEIVMLGDRFYVKATATLKNSAGEIEQTTGFAREEEKSPTMQQPQLTGASSSYARKYALNGLFCIDDTKCDDAMKQMEEKMEESIRAKIAAESKGSSLTQANQQAKPATSIVVDEAQLAIAIDDLRRATNNAQLKQAYQTWVGFKGNPKFDEVVKEMGAKYPSKKQ